jgi:hypothetical protein
MKRTLLVPPVWPGVAFPAQQAAVRDSVRLGAELMVPADMNFGEGRAWSTQRDTFFSSRANVNAGVRRHRRAA